MVVAVAAAGVEDENYREHLNISFYSWQSKGANHVFFRSQ